MKTLSAQDERDNMSDASYDTAVLNENRGFHQNLVVVEAFSIRRTGLACNGKTADKRAAYRLYCRVSGLFSLGTRQRRRQRAARTPEEIDEGESWRTSRV